MPRVASGAAIRDSSLPAVGRLCRHAIRPPGSWRPWSSRLRLDSFTLTVEIASEPESRERGLMFRHNLPEDRGMLFEYETPQRISMWMKNTFIPLDMIFIRSDGIGGGGRRAHYSAIPRHHPGGGTVVAVLEVAAGTSERLGIARGSVIRHRFFGNSQ